MAISNYNGTMMRTLLIFNLPKRWDDEARDALYFYPDVLDCHYTHKQYKEEWNKLSKERGGYLIVQNGQLNRVGWLRFAFEAVKGWFGFLGFSNNCHPAKVKMAALKLLYYGYLNEFNKEASLDVINGWDKECQPDEGYIVNSKENRTDDISSNLQDQLVACYQENAADLNALKSFDGSLPLPHQDRSFIFGNTYAIAEEIESSVRLDVQNEQLISGNISKLKNGELTLPDSTCRRLYINHIFTTIEQTFEEILRTRTAGISLLNLSRYFSTPRNDRVILGELHTKAEMTLALWPSLSKNYIDFLIKLNIALACQEPHDIPNRKVLYTNAYNLIVSLQDKGQINDYLQQYFYNDEGFVTLPFESEVVQGWGEYLFESFLETCRTLETKNACRYRIAQIRPDMIPDSQLPVFINSCLLLDKYNIASGLIERLSGSNMQRSMKYIKDNHRNLVSLLKQNTPLSQAYAKELVNDAKSTYRLVNFFTDKEKNNYEAAAALDSETIYGDAAPYFLRKYVNHEQWEAAFSLLEVRKTKGLPVEELPTVELDKIADHFVTEGERLRERGDAIQAEDFSTAEQHYQESLQMMEMAVFAQNSHKYRHLLNEHRRYMAECIFDGDEVRHSITLPRLDEALAYLAPIDFKEYEQAEEYLESLAKVHIRILEHKVRLLHENCLGAGRDDRTVHETHLNKCHNFIMPLIDSIDSLIEIREASHSNDPADNNSRLAYLHFLKGDVIKFFKLEKDDRCHYKKAIELEPNQAFFYYSYSVSILLSNPELSREMLAKSGELLSRIPALSDGMTAQEAHLHWLRELWVSEKTYNIKMPEPVPVPEEPSSFLSRFGF